MEAATARKQAAREGRYGEVVRPRNGGDGTVVLETAHPYPEGDAFETVVFFDDGDGGAKGANSSSSNSSISIIFDPQSATAQFYDNLTLKWVMLKVELL